MTSETEAIPTKSRAQTSAWVRRRYVIALSVIGLLAITAYGIFETVLTRHQDVLTIVNISGRQRMLSQQTALFAQQMVSAETYEEGRLWREKLTQASQRFEKAHIGLTKGDVDMGLPAGMSPRVRSMYYGGPDPLDQKVQHYLALLKELLAISERDRGSQIQVADHILTVAAADLVSSLDAMVAQYQTEGEAAFKSLHWIETAVLVATLLTLMLEALFIFNPMARRIAVQLSEIAKIQNQLEQYSHSLEEEVINRTRELMAAKSAAERANRNKTKFLAAASHDLRQPLEAMGMFMGLLKRPGLDDRSKQVLHDMRTAHDSTRLLLESILEISKIETGSIDTDLEDFPINSLLAPLARDYGERAKKKGLALHYVESSAMVRSDQHLLERIIRNLISNAVRYTNAGRIIIGCKRQGDNIDIVVADSGPGIADADITSIFEAFTQLTDQNRDRSEGIGLGLTICDRLSNLLGHAIIVRSIPGRGTQFRLRMPFTDTDMEINAYDTT